MPARPCSAPALDDLGREAKADELARTGRLGAAALVDHSARKQGVGEFGKFLVLVRLDDVSVNALEIRARVTARGGFVHDRWPFAC